MVFWEFLFVCHAFEAQPPTHMRKAEIASSLFADAWVPIVPQSLGGEVGGYLTLLARGACIYAHVHPSLPHGMRIYMHILLIFPARAGSKQCLGLRLLAKVTNSTR